MHRGERWCSESQRIGPRSDTEPSRTHSPSSRGRRMGWEGEGPGESGSCGVCGSVGLCVCGSVGCPASPPECPAAARPPLPPALLSPSLPCPSPFLTAGSGFRRGAAAVAPAGHRHKGNARQARPPRQRRAVGRGREAPGADGRGGRRGGVRSAGEAAGAEGAGAPRAARGAPGRAPPGGAGGRRGARRVRRAGRGGGRGRAFDAARGARAPAGGASGRRREGAEGVEAGVRGGGAPAAGEPREHERAA